MYFQPVLADPHRIPKLGGKDGIVQRGFEDKASHVIYDGHVSRVRLLGGIGNARAYVASPSSHLGLCLS
jgi:hypothetical protein